MTTTTRTSTDTEITYTAVEAGTEVAWLTITADTRVVLNVETAADWQRQGLATLLWDAANAEAEVLHQQEHHRTEEGEAFAQAMGGESADETTDYCEHCCICTDDTRED